MNGRAIVLMVCLATLALMVPSAAAYGGTSINQGRFYSDAKGNEIFSNEWETNQGSHRGPIVVIPIPMEGGNGFGSYGSAFAASNCQLLVAVDVHVAVIASASALAVISDEDEVVITSTPGPMQRRILPDVSNETADADCNTPVGPVLIEVVTASGWGEPASLGVLSDALGALSGGQGKRGYGDDIRQGRFTTKATLDDAFHNEWHLDQAVSNGAAAAANCQAIIAVHDSLLVAGMASADATIEDNDEMVITGDAGTAGFQYDRDTGIGRGTEFTINNDHVATDSCSQPIESITIIVRPDSSTIPPRS